MVMLVCLILPLLLSVSSSSAEEGMPETCLELPHYLEFLNTEIRWDYSLLFGIEEIYFQGVGCGDTGEEFTAVQTNETCEKYTHWFCSAIMEDV